MTSQKTDTPTGEDNQPFLRLERINKKFGNFIALQDISLDVEAGEFVVFLGPSGCGKTTLLRIIAGLEIQTGGLIHQSGHEISALPPASRDFGIVFQSYALFPNLSVFDNVAYGLKSDGSSKKIITQRVTELLDLVNLPKEAHKYPAQLSGGQQQRLAVARAIATSPSLLLLDEPLSALDAQVRLHLRYELKQLQRTERSKLMVSDLTEWPLRSSHLATTPMSDNIAKTVLPENHGLSDTRQALWAFRKDRFGRIVTTSA